MLKKEANKITGGLSAPGKMPEGSYNLPASACQTGQILAKVEGTPCSGCYALKNRYAMPIQKAAMERRLKSLMHPRWTEAMTVLVKGKKHFRWHDSGDIQSVEHLKRIFEVCNRTPETWHWLPTRERKFLPLSTDSIPKNLTIRFSSHMINQPPVKSWPWPRLRESSCFGYVTLVTLRSQQLRQLPHWLPWSCAGQGLEFCTWLLLMAPEDCTVDVHGQKVTGP